MEVSQELLPSTSLIDLSPSTSTYTSTSISSPPSTSSLPQNLFAPHTSSTPCDVSVFPSGLEFVEEVFGISDVYNGAYKHLFPPISGSQLKKLHSPLPSFEERMPEPEFLFHDMPDLDFDYGEDATPEESVPMPCFALVDLSPLELTSESVAPTAEVHTAKPRGRESAQSLDLLGSVGHSLPTLMMPGAKVTINSQEVFEHPSVAKPSSSVSVSIVGHSEPGTAPKSRSRRKQWKSRRTRAKYNFSTKQFERCVQGDGVEFEDLTINELRLGDREPPERHLE